jgi:methionyl-tRNA formyltransferase
MMRVGLLSYSAAGFALLHRICSGAGHVPVVYVYARSLSPGRRSDPGAGAAVAEMVGTAAPGVHLLLPGDGSGLEQMLPGCELDLIVCGGFSWKLSAAVLGASRLGVLNVHPSLLPRYRGPIPIHWAIRNGDPEIGVTIHRMDETFDTGPIIVQKGGVPLEGTDEVDADLLFERLDALTAELLPIALERVAGGFPGEPQEETGASYAPWMEPGFSRIDWSRTRREIHNQVRTFRFGVRGSPGPVGRLGDGWVRVLRTSLDTAAGTAVECSDGPIWLLESVPIPAPES